jgi:hypothetical protein
MKKTDSNAQLHFHFETDNTTSSLPDTKLICFQQAAKARNAEAIRKKEQDIFQKILRVSKRYTW